MINEQIQLLSLDISSNMVDVRNFDVENDPIVTSSDISDLVASDGSIGMIMTGFRSENLKYALLLSAKRGYVEVPWIDSVLSDAIYDPDTKQLILKFKSGTKKPIKPISVDVADLVNEYYADNLSITCNTVDGNKTFSVLSGFIPLSSSYSTSSNKSISASYSNKSISSDFSDKSISARYSSYAISSSAADSLKDKTLIGSLTKPIYFNNGIPVSCNRELCSASEIETYLSLGNLAKKNESDLNLGDLAKKNESQLSLSLYAKTNDVTSMLSNLENWDSAYSTTSKLSTTIFTYKTVDNDVVTLSIATFKN